MTDNKTEMGTTQVLGTKYVQLVDSRHSQNAGGENHPTRPCQKSLKLSGLLTDWKPVFIQLALPLWIIEVAVLVQSGNIAIASDSRFLGVGILQMTFQIVRPRERLAAIRHPAEISITFVMYCFLVPLLVLLALEAFLGAIFTDTTLETTRELILLNHGVAVKASLAWR